MFTGLIEETAPLVSVTPISGEHPGARLTIEAPLVAVEGEGTQIGDSIAVNGCCLTATTIDGAKLSFDLLGETLARTNLGNLQPGALVNLERALPANGRLGGHFVQGHVDCVSSLLSLNAHGQDHRLEIALPPEFAHLVIDKGSITINGISLTIAEVKDESIVVWIIPHTFRVTNLGSLKVGDPVNLEFDVLAKYMERLTKLQRTC